MGNFADLYNYYMVQQEDPRIRTWALMSSPWPTVVIASVYLGLVTFLPRGMATRTAFNLKGFMFCYNLLLVFWSAYMFIEILIASVFNKKFDLSCATIDYSQDPLAVKLLWSIYLFYLSKIVELLDTIIFILRKKNNQVTFLHVYHHATMPLLWWAGVKWVGGGEGFCAPLFNSLVHVFMYAYYAFSGLGPQVQKYLWWKKYITMIQLTQFYTVMGKTVLTFWMGCDYPQAYLWAQFLYMGSLALLFSNFYQKAYKTVSRMSVTSIEKEVVLQNGHQNGVLNGVVTNGDSRHRATKI